MQSKRNLHPYPWTWKRMVALILNTFFQNAIKAVILWEESHISVSHAFNVLVLPYTWDRSTAFYSSPLVSLTLAGRFCFLLHCMHAIWCYHPTCAKCDFWHLEAVACFDLWFIHMTMRHFLYKINTFCMIGGTGSAKEMHAVKWEWAFWFNETSHLLLFIFCFF